MKKNIITLIVILATFVAHSQTPSPTPNPFAGTYQDVSLSVAQRIALANTLISSGTADEANVASAAAYMLSARPVLSLYKSFPNFAQTINSDPTMRGLVMDATRISLLYRMSTSWLIDEAGTIDDKLSIAASHKDSPLLLAGDAWAAQKQWALLLVSKSNALNAAGQNQDAIDTAIPASGLIRDALKPILKGKIALRAPDCLSWAKVVYLTADWPHTQDGINAVTSAYRAMDIGIERANVFIQFQKTGEGNDPLADVPLPKGIHFGDNDDFSLAMNYAISGDKVSALKSAVSAYSSAPAGFYLNFATGLVAQCLRNLDGNLVRANAFVTAQSQGKQFDIVELHQ